MIYKSSQVYIKALHIHTVSLTVSYHHFWFPTGWYSVANNGYFVKKNDKNLIVLMKTTKNVKKAYVNIVSIRSILYSELASLTRDAPNTKEI